MIANENWAEVPKKEILPVLLSTHRLLSEPDPTYSWPPNIFQKAYDGVVKFFTQKPVIRLTLGEQWQQNNVEFETKARAWTAQYAKPSNVNKNQNCLNMRFNEKFCYLQN